MTNRELISRAMPLRSLSKAEWKSVLKHAEKTKLTDKDAFNIINVILVNQARIEVMSNYNDYYYDKLEEEIPESSSPLLL